MTLKRAISPINATLSVHFDGSKQNGSRCYALAMHNRNTGIDLYDLTMIVASRSCKDTFRAL